MAFENPLLRPSATRQAALQYLWSDEPESAIQASPAPSSSSSSIANFFGVGEASPSTAPAAPAAPAAPTSSEGGENSSGIAVAEATPYGGLFGGLPGLAVSAIGMGIPGFKAMYGAASGYGGQVSANNLGTAMDAWGGDPNVSGSPALAALGGAFGYTPEGLENAKAFAGNFSSEANMTGYIAAATDPTIGDLTNAAITEQVGQQDIAYTADDYGKIAAEITATIAAANAETQAAAEAAYAEQEAANAAAQAQAEAQAQAQAAAEEAAAAQAAQAQAEAQAQAQAAADEAAAAQAAAVANSSSGGDSSGGYSAGDGGYGSGQVGYDAGDMGHGDSGGGGGGGKIVCTAMNESYGFGSYRNAIWLKYSADKMTKAHEAGYHALFLPLVDLAYKRNNKPVRIALEHIARHRTTDLRAEMRNTKRDKLGRAYRFMLEPLCYVVGKIKGY
jgi:hypothetical protein